MSRDVNGPNRTAVGGFLRCGAAIFGDGIDDHLRRFAVGQVENLRAEGRAKTAADAGLAVDNRVHKNTPFGMIIKRVFPRKDKKIPAGRRVFYKCVLYDSDTVVRNGRLAQHND